MLKSIFIKLLCWLASRVVRRYRPRIVAITGSLGKTSAKEAIVTVLKEKFRVRGAIKNYNTEAGAALTIFGLPWPGRHWWNWLSVFYRGFALYLGRDKNYPEILILEMAADRPGDLRKLVHIATPEVAVVTAVGSAHLEFFGSLEKIAREKLTVPLSVPESGLAILDQDDVLVSAMQEKIKAPVKTYGLSEEAEIRALEPNIWEEEDEEYPRSLKGMRCKVALDGSVVPLAISGALGSGVVRAALAALAVGQHFGLHIVEMSATLSLHLPPPGRMRLIPGIKWTMLLDDTYNASLEATESALEVFSNLPAGRKIAVLGDMLELGHETVNAHYAIGRLAVESKTDLLFTIGTTARLIGIAAQHRGMDPVKIFHFDKAEAAGLKLQKLLQKGDVVLVKGSQAMRMEKIVKELMADPLQACSLLVRQDDAWACKT